MPTCQLYESYASRNFTLGSGSNILPRSEDKHATCVGTCFDKAHQEAHRDKIRKVPAGGAGHRQTAPKHDAGRQPNTWGDFLEHEHVRNLADDEAILP